MTLVSAVLRPLWVATVLLCVGCSGKGDSAPAPRPSEPLTVPEARPNIVVFFTDDHGFADLGLQSDSTAVHTPNTDQLARDGVLFSHGFVTAPQCAPSRAGLITGIYQGVFGMENNSQGPLPQELKTIADYLREVGYRTGMAGKWHLDVDQNTRQNVPEGTDELLYKPGARGFDEYFEGRRNGFLASHDASGHAVQDAPAMVRDTRFRVDAATAWGRQFIRRHAERPFFLFLPYFAPHVPLEAPQADLDLFDSQLEEKRRTALAMIHAMDRGVGEIREELAAHGLGERTLIFYAGDNGAPTFEHLANGSSNAPLVGEKGMLTDGGVRVPFVAAWPGVIPANTQYGHLVSSLDIAATALVASGQPVPSTFRGQNLLPALTDESLPPVRESLYWRFLTQAAVRTQNWKVVALSDGQRFLFDMSSPEGERENLAEVRPDLLETMLADLSQWAEGLQPPGLPTGPLHEGDRVFYQHHGLLENPDAQ